MPSKSRQLLGLVLLAVFLFPFGASAFDITPTSFYTDYTQEQYTQFSINKTLPSDDYLAGVASFCEPTGLGFGVFNLYTVTSTASTPCLGNIVFIGTTDYNAFWVPPLTLAQARISPYRQGEFVFQYIPLASFSGISDTDVSALISSVSTAIISTGYNLWPIVAVVIGLILSFYGIKEVIRLFRK
jgi:hypothetical protein